MGCSTCAWCSAPSERFAPRVAVSIVSQVATEILGWLSSLVLLATIATQIRKQWKDHTSKGVSLWLYVGQLVASTGFIVYSALVANWVFVVTNVCMLIANLCGLWITGRHRRRTAART
jgi:MtN3 and saliva related transmembrane protein